MTRFYGLSDGAANPGLASPPTRGWLPSLIARSRTTCASGELALDLDVQGIHCAACVWLIDRLFEGRPGARVIDINPGLGRLRLVVDDPDFDVAAFLDDLAAVGYLAAPPSRDVPRASDGLGVRVGLTIAFALNAMILSSAVYLGLSPADDEGLFDLFVLLMLGLATASVLVGGPVFFRGAWAALRRKTLHLDVPIALGLLLGYVGSVALLLAGRPEDTYFDTLTVFVALMLVGRWLQRRLVERHRRMLLADDGLASLRIKEVTSTGEVRWCALGEITQGAQLLVTPGELLPVAAVGTEDLTCSLAWINGESAPVAFPAGTEIPAGAHLAGAAARVTALESYEQSSLRALVEHSETRRPDRGTERFWHRTASLYVVGVLIAAAAGVVAWWGTGPVNALEVAVAVLVVTCPCAIGLATPLAYEMAHARLRKRGLYVRRGGLLDRARHVRQVFFDKTGTLTLGELALADPGAIERLDHEARQALFQLSARSKHPKSLALFEALVRREDMLALAPTVCVDEVPGVGLRVVLAGVTWALERDAATERLTLRRDGVVQGHFDFDERLRHDARAEVDRLAAIGVDVWLVSGDRAAKVAPVAAALGIPSERVRAAMTPEAKATLVKAHDRGDTMFVGDGINDVLAFDAATCAGTPAIDQPAVPARADFFLVRAGLGPIAETLQLARRLRQTIHRNLAFAVTYNVVGVGLALAGVLSPLLCAVLMPASSLTVVLWTAWSLRAPSNPRSRGEARIPLSPGRATA